MTNDLELLRSLIFVMMCIAAFTTTAFPLLYAFAPWYKSRLGRGLMLQGIAIALALDLTVLFAIWTPTNILVLFWVSFFGFAFIAMATGYLTWKMLKHNFIIPHLHLKETETDD